YPVATVTSITPSAGPALGGGTVTIVGTNFTSKTTATLGGNAMTSVVVASDGLSFTATVPAHAASSTAVDLKVTTEGGAVTKTAYYTYQNGIVVSPSTMVGSALQTLDISGVGFSAITFTDTAADGNGKVYLVNGKYDARDQDSDSAKDNPDLYQCVNVQV